jgi:hypothetical protein
MVGRDWRLLELRLQRAQMRAERAAHRQTAPADCDCLWCTGIEAATEAADQRRADHLRIIGPPPF